MKEQTALRGDAKPLLPPRPHPDRLESIRTAVHNAGHVIRRLSSRAGLRSAREDLERVEDVLITLSLAVEARDPYTEGHSRRLAEMAERLGSALGLSAGFCQHLRRAGLLHDIGKIGISDGILKKSGPLTEDEWREMRAHPEIGVRICAPLHASELLMNGILFHHERWDGAGYPWGLAGEEIPLEGRILAVVDAFDAMTSDRPYRCGRPVAEARAILKEGAGVQWDPALVEAFLCDESESAPAFHVVGSEERRLHRVAVLLFGGV